MIFALSNTTGEGVSELRTALTHLCVSAPTLLNEQVNTSLTLVLPSLFSKQASADQF